MYIELVAEYQGERVELVGSMLFGNGSIDGVDEYLAVVRKSEGHKLDAVHPSKLTIIERPENTFEIDLVNLLQNEGTKTSFKPSFDAKHASRQSD